MGFVVLDALRVGQIATIATMTKFGILLLAASAFAQKQPITLETLRTALDAEVRAEQARDRAYWEPLRRELEAFRHAERHDGTGAAI